MTAMLPPENCQLEYDGFIIGVHAAHPADLEWLLEFMSPAFDVTQGKRADVEVSYVVDNAAFEALHRRCSDKSGELYDGFVLDDSTLRFPRWAEAAPGGDTRVAFDARRDTFFETGPGFGVRIIANNRDRSRVNWMRVIREFAMNACMRRGDVFLHAACFTSEDRAIVISGVKNAGKTTTLTWCLELLEAAGFMSDDRVRMRALASGYEARAMPTIMTFRAPSLALLPKFAVRLRQVQDTQRLSSSELAAGRVQAHINSLSDGRVGLAPQRYAQLLGRESTPSAPVAAIVFPEVVDDSGGLDVCALKPAAAGERLQHALFGVSNLQRRSDLFDYLAAGEEPSPDETRARAQRIVEHVPSYAWRLGSSAPKAGAQLREFLQGLR